MASKPRHLSDRERSEIVGAIRPLVDRFSNRFGVAPSSVLVVVQEAGPVADRSTLPANYVPSNPIMARLLAAAARATTLSPAAIVEDVFDDAERARDCVIFCARNKYDLSYNTIGTALGGMDPDAVLDGYCRAIGLSENKDRDFNRLLHVVSGGKL